MNSKSLVSVVVIFLNAGRYMREAIESVFAQHYPHWELLLVDDGSTDGSSAIARGYATEREGQVRYLQHPGHQNRGKGASRNLGIRHTRGEYVAFLDADDVWLPHKLAEQVALLDAHEDAGMLYGETLYWYSWTGEPGGRERDFRPALGVPLNTPIEPPALLPLFLRGKAAVPCTCSILVRRSALAAVGGFDVTFTAAYNIYEDQAFYAKICLNSVVVVSGKCWDRYRQHPAASMAVARETGQEVVARRFFLQWLEQYLIEERIADVAVWGALRRELWRLRYPAWLPSNARLGASMQWLKKWLLRIEERLLPSLVGRWLWGPLV